MGRRHSSNILTSSPKSYFLRRGEDKLHLEVGLTCQSSYCLPTQLAKVSPFLRLPSPYLALVWLFLPHSLCLSSWVRQKLAGGSPSISFGSLASRPWCRLGGLCGLVTSSSVTSSRPQLYLCEIFHLQIVQWSANNGGQDEGILRAQV